MSVLRGGRASERGGVEFRLRSTDDDSRRNRRSQSRRRRRILRKATTADFLDAVTIFVG